MTIKEQRLLACKGECITSVFNLFKEYHLSDSEIEIMCLRLSKYFLDAYSNQVDNKED